jgi:DNA-directed RNA polymerase subunit RPC12/RpoP
MGIHCPDCGSLVRRSRAQGIGERLVRTLMRYRAYRCLECGWRGWVGEPSSFRERWSGRLQTIISALIVIFLVLFTFYMTSLE